MRPPVTETAASVPTHHRLVIIGSGPAGYTAAVYAARAMLVPLLIQGIQPGGQLTITTEVENWPGDASVMGPDLMTRMEAHAREMGARIVSDTVTRLDLSRRPFAITCDSGLSLTAEAVILATGAPPADDPPAGVVAWLEKPFSRPALLAQVARALPVGGGLRV